jgi:hypothetical protein
LVAAVDKAGLLALQPSAAIATNPKINMCHIKVIPPFLAKALINMRLSDAAKLGMWMINKALLDYKHMATSPGAAAVALVVAAANTAAGVAAAPATDAAGAAMNGNDATAARTVPPTGAPVTPTGPTAISVFCNMAYFLWLVVMEDTVKSADLQVNMSSPQATTWISGNQARVSGAASIPRFHPPNGLPTVGRDAHLSQSLSQLDGMLGSLPLKLSLLLGPPKNAHPATRPPGHYSVREPPIVDADDPEGIGGPSIGCH